MVLRLKVVGTMFHNYVLVPFSESLYMFQEKNTTPVQDKSALRYHNIITSLACGCNSFYALKNSSAFFGLSSFLIAIELLIIYFSG